MKKIHLASYPIVSIVLFALLVMPVQAGDNVKPVREQHEAPGTVITTAELKQLLLEGKTPIIDVRPVNEYDVSHVPGAISIFETEIERMTQVGACKPAGAVLYCNGPYCHKTDRVAESLSKKGCTAIKKYKEGIPVWRALGNAAETSLAGFKFVFSKDKTAVFVDARSKDEFKAGTVPGAVNFQAREIEAANKDGRLPYKEDHGTRIIVFGSSLDQARKLAEAIAHRAYWNTSYLAGTYDDLKRAGLWQ